MYGHAIIKYTAGILLDSFVFCPFSHFSTQRLWVMEKFKVVFSLFRARTRTPWNSSWPAGIFANPSGKSVWNIMRFLDFLKSPNQSQSLFFLVEGHHFGSGKESASDLSSRHADISPQDFPCTVAYRSCCAIQPGDKVKGSCWEPVGALLGHPSRPRGRPLLCPVWMPGARQSTWPQ